MEFEIKIKPLVLFDLEDKIHSKEQQSAGAGRQFYQHFLSDLTTLQSHHDQRAPLYQSVKEFTAVQSTCKLFYMVNGETIYIMGLL